MHPQSATLTEAFALSLDVRTITLVGGGGKTSLMFALARELVARGKTVVTTTTTKIFTPSAEESPFLQLIDDDPALRALPQILEQYRHVTVGQRVDGATGKLEAVSQETLNLCLSNAEHVIVEADGCAGRPIKAPEEWEPVIPAQTDLLIPVVGLDCLEKPASAASVFRLHRFLAVTGLHEGDAITQEAVATVITHSQGITKGADPAVRCVPFLNKLDTLHQVDLVGSVARSVFGKQPSIRTVVAGQLKPEIWLMVFSA